MNEQFANHILEQLATLAPDVRPQWGKMNRAQLFGHLRSVLQYAMGEGPAMEFRGNWNSRYLFRPMILHGLVAMPRNVRVPRPKGMKEHPQPPEATFEEFEAALGEYVRRHQAGEIAPQMHPFFGLMDRRDWARFHRAHFRHHLRQFGLRI